MINMRRWLYFATWEGEEGEGGEKKKDQYSRKKLLLLLRRRPNVRKPLVLVRDNWERL